MTTGTLPPATRTWSPLTAAAIAAAATLVICLPLAPGPAGLVGLLLAAGTIASGGIALGMLAPHLLVTAVPMLIPSPMFMLTFAWELAVLALVVFTLVHGLRSNAAWIGKLGAVEGCWLAYLGWAVFTGFWCTDLRYYALDVRRLVVGFLTLWLALRLAHVAPRAWFERGVVLGAMVLSLAMLRHNTTTGYSLQQALLHRGEATNLGWGKDNYISGLLLICSPLVLRCALRGAARDRLLAAIGFALITAVQIIIASRAGSLLFVVGTMIQLLHATRRHRVVVGLTAAAVVAALIASPLGVVMLTRVTDLREFASFTIRIWYWREGFRRLIEHLPWGMGLGQGFANGDHLHGIDPHDYWLLIGGDLGIPGMLLWAGLLVAIVRAWRSVRFDGPSRELAFTMLLTVALGNVHALVEPTFEGPQYQMLFLWIVFGSLAYVRADRERAADLQAAATARSVA